MKHIVIDARIINTSTGRYVERLIHYLEKIDTTNRYTLLIPTKDLSFYTPKNPNFTIQACDTPNYSLQEQTTLLQQLKRLKPDLVHFCMPQQPIMYTGQKVTTIHDLTLLNTWNTDKNWLIYHIKQKIGTFVFRSACKTNVYIFAPTHHTKRDIIERFPSAKDKTIVTYEAADKLHSGKTTPYPTPFKQFLLYVGQQSDYKNIVRLAEAHQALLKDTPDLGLVLVGKLNKSAQNNKALFEKRGYQNIHFTGFVEDSQRDWLYEQCAAYVFPSTMEGFGLPGLEAMLYQAPLISSNASCQPEVYGDAAEYFDPYDVADMTKKIKTVINSPAHKKRLVKAGDKQVKKYSWERMARQTHAAYLQALDQEKSS